MRKEKIIFSLKNISTGFNDRRRSRSPRIDRRERERSKHRSRSRDRKKRRSRDRGDRDGDDMDRRRDRSDREKDKKRKNRSRSRDRSERKRDRRDRERDKDRKDRKPDLRESDIKIKEEPVDGKSTFCIFVVNGFFFRSLSKSVSMLESDFIEIIDVLTIKGLLR